MATKKKRTRTAILYVRVSTAQQVDGLSLDGQERTLIAAATAAGYAQDEISVRREEGRSGAAINSRPVLVDVLADLAAGRADALYVVAIDRLARSLIDALTIADLAQKQSWRLVSLDLGLDTGSTVGKMVLAVLAGAAELERDRIAARHRAWHQEKRARGLVWGVDEGPKALVPAEIRTAIADARARGLSLRAIADEMNAQEIPTARGGKWHASTIRHLLNSPSMQAVA